MERISDVESRLCLVWTTEKPYVNSPRKSSSFTLFGAKWNLQMMCAYPYVQYIALCLRQETKRKKLEKSFRVTTFIENVDRDFASLDSITDVHTTFQVIWQISEEQASENFPGCLQSKHWRIVCLFHNEVTSMLPNKSRIKDISDRNGTDLSVSFGIPPDLERLSTDFSNLFKDKVFSDVKLKCGDQTFPAHKAILAARSVVFADIFRNKMEDSKTDIFDVTDLEAQTLDLLLNYLYSGKLQGLSGDTVSSLYAVSDKYAVHALKKSCSDRMIKSVTEDNCVSFLIMADAHSDVAFKDAVISFICFNEEVLESEIWQKFSDEHPRLANAVYQRAFRHKRRKLDSYDEDSD